MFSAPFLSTLLRRVKAVVRRVARPVAACARRAAAGASERQAQAISPVLRGAAGEWMRARLRALSAVMRRIEAGERLDRPGRRSRRTASRGDGARGERGLLPPEARLPRGFGWMCAFVPEVRRDGAAFAAWLGEPAMQARFSAAPETMARAVGPILTAVGQGRPEWFPAMGSAARRRCADSSSAAFGDLGISGDAGAGVGDRRVKPGDDGCAVETKSTVAAPPLTEGAEIVASPNRNVSRPARISNTGPGFCSRVTLTGDRAPVDARANSSPRESESRFKCSFQFLRRIRDPGNARAYCYDIET
jgi:hypothetical protein